MKTDNSLPSSSLALPGAGLPWLELQIGRLIFNWRRLTGGRQGANVRFESERESIRKIIESRSPEALAERVLIKRVPGMEDSSRHWSLLMTLDHLRIMHRQIARVIGTLAAGKAMTGTASTAKVKPSPDVAISVVQDYEDASDLLVKTVANIPELRTKTRFAHPWFGALDAAGWHVLAATHLGIHRAQMRRIAQNL